VALQRIARNGYPVYTAFADRKRTTKTTGDI
jgi:hypothetical protein